MDSPFRLRPMDLRDILDDTFDLYKENFALFVTISAIVFLPFNFLLVTISGQIQGTEGADPEIMAMVAFGVTIFLTVLLGTVATYIGMGALTVAVSERYLGRSVSVKEAYANVLSRFGPFLLTLILSMILAIFGGALFTMVPIGIAAAFWFVHPALGVLLGFILVLAGILAAVYLWFGLYFVIPAFVIEGRSGTDAISRSFQLFNFNWMKAFGTLFLVTMIVAILQSVLVSPISMMLGFIAGEGGLMSFLVLGIQGALAGVAQSVLQPIQMIVQLLLYYDIRIRREGYDLEILATELRGESAAGAAPYADAPVEQPLGEEITGE